MNVTEVEREKYERIWSVPEYRQMSPGESWIPLFLEMAGNDRGTLLDAGCGTGRAGKALEGHGFKATLFDLTFDALEVQDVAGVRGCLWRSVPTNGGSRFTFGYCCDVMEHIPPEFTMLAADNLLRSCQRVFFSISTMPDVFGQKIGEPLHLTVQPFTWWRDRFMELGDVIEARDMISTAVFLVQR